MGTILKNTTISGTNNLTLSPNSTANRPSIITSIVRWTNTGSQSYSVLAGPTPTITNTSWTAPAGVTQVEVLCVGGGGGGGYNGGGGGGAGGLLYSTAYTVVPGTIYTVTVGTGGAPSLASANVASAGTNSVFGALTASGGGGGNSRSTTSGVTAGGSGGGGAAAGTGFANSAGTGVAGQGTNGGVGTPADLGANAAGGGGGGAGTSGQAGSYVLAGGGGTGLNFSITGTPTWYAGGGGSGTCVNGVNPAQGGLGGGGGGGIATSAAGVNGTVSTGGGGGGGNGSGTPGTGGSGVVIIRYAVTSTNTTPLGIMQYNSDLKAIEVYEGPATGWISQDPLRNFAGHNLLTYSEQFDNAAWSTPAAPVAATISTNSILAPDGTLTADTVNYSATTAHPCYQQATFAIPNGMFITSSMYIKQSAGTSFALQCTTFNSAGVLQDGYANITFDGSGVASVAASNAYMTVSSIDVGNGWYRIQATNTNQAGSAGTYARISIGQRSQVGSIYVWGAQLEQSM
mgnify:FL=1